MVRVYIQEQIQTNDDEKYFPFFFEMKLNLKKKNENEKNLTKFLKKIIASKHWKKYCLVIIYFL